VEVLPGVGVASARIGDRRDEVIAVNGPDVSSRVVRGNRDVHANNLVVSYDEDDRVELVEVALGGGQAWYQGTQLTSRLMDDVVADLTARGLDSQPNDLGHVFRMGFALFSMSSLSPYELGLSDDPDDEREVVEGVSIAPWDYFQDG
jgi:hypothetical protein